MVIIGGEKSKWKSIYINGKKSKYSVSDTGLIRNNKTGKYLISWCNKMGYAYVGLCVNGYEKSYRVHRLVAKAFIRNPKKKLEVNHINGVKLDNNVENLEWVTTQENILHSYKQGLHSITGRRTKLTEEEKIKIANLLRENKKSISCIATEVGVSRRSVSKLYNKGCFIDSKGNKYDFSGYTYKTQFGLCGEKNCMVKHTAEQIKKVCELLEECKYTKKEISEKTQVSPATVSFVHAGSTWVEISMNYNFHLDRNSKSNREAVEKVFDYLQSGTSVEEISKITGMKESMIKFIDRGIRWKPIIDAYIFYRMGRLQILYR